MHKRARLCSWDEYGITKKRYRELALMCKDSQYLKLVEDAARESDERIARYIIQAVTNDLTYEDVEYTGGRIPCGRTDFYGYRRRYFYIFDRKLKSGTTFDSTCEKIEKEGEHGDHQQENQGHSPIREESEEE